MVTAYVIVDIEVTDPEQYEEYKRMAPPLVALYGGKYLARGGRVEVFEGDWSPKRLVILEFESLEQARQWMDSPEYATARRLRQQTTHSNMVVVEGLAQGFPVP
jgi:uncharacterized protein (DUF1330 family)